MMRATAKKGGRARTAAGKALLAMVVLLVTLGVGSGVARADGTVENGNPDCADLVPGSAELKVDPPTGGLHSKGEFSLDITLRTLAADDPAHPEDQTGDEVFDFTATGGVVTAVIVKGGDDANFYDYRPGGTTSATGLHAPVNPANDKFHDLSHMSFCYGDPGDDPDDPVTPGPETPSVPDVGPQAEVAGVSVSRGELARTGVDEYRWAMVALALLGIGAVLTSAGRQLRAAAVEVSGRE